MTQEVSQLLVELGKLAGGLVAVSAAGLVTHRFVVRREADTRRQKARDEFRLVVAKQRTKLDLIGRLQSDQVRWQREVEFHRESVDAFIEAVHHYRAIATEEEWARVDAVLEEYRAHEEPHRYVGMTRQHLDQKSGETYSQRLHAYLDRFDAAVTG